MYKQPTVLLIGTDGRIPYSLETILRECAHLRKAHTVGEAGSLNGNCAAIVCPWLFHGGTWQTVLTEAQVHCPDTPVIVYRHDGSEQEWLQVLAAGAFDLLAAPFNKISVLSLIEHAAATCDARDARRSPA